MKKNEAITIIQPCGTTPAPAKEATITRVNVKFNPDKNVWEAKKGDAKNG